MKTSEELLREIEERQEEVERLKDGLKDFRVGSMGRTEILRRIMRLQEEIRRLTDERESRQALRDDT